MGQGTAWSKASDLNDKKKFYGSMADTGSNLGSLIPVGGAAKMGAQLTTKAILGNVAKTGGMNAITNTIGEGGRQLSDEGKLNPKGLAVSAGMGAALPIAGYGLGKVAKAGAQPVQNTIKGLTKENLGAISPKFGQSVAMATPDGQVIRGLDRFKTNQAGFARSTEESPVLKKLGIVKDGEAMSVDPLEALKAEARKYKSAEEFVKAKTNQYHGTLDNNYKLDPNNRLFLTGDSDSASTYAGRRYNQDPEGKVVGYHAKDGKTLDLNDNATREKYVREVVGQDKQLKKYYDRIPESIRKDYYDTLDWVMEEHKAGRIPKADLDKYTEAQKNYKGISSKDVYANWDKIIERAKKDGYDYIKHTTEDPSAEITFPETVALNPRKSLLDDKQLTDLYNQAHQSAPVEKTPQYLYHGTGNINLESITKEGLKPGLTSKRISLSRTEPYATSFAESSRLPAKEGQGAVLRVRADLIKGKTRPGNIPNSDRLNELVTNKVIPPEALEIKVNGKWQPLAAPVEKTALTPREEIKIINRKAAHRGDKYTISEEKRIAELQKQINEEPTQKTSPVNETQRLDRPVTVEDWVNRGYTRERAEKIVQHKQTVNMLNDEWAGKQINDGMNAEVISAEDMRLDKTKPGREIITSVQDYKIYKDNSGNEHYRLKINKQIVDHTPETAQKRIDALEKQKAFMGELPEPLQKELDQLHGIDGKAMSVEPKSAPVEKTASKANKSSTPVQSPEPETQKTLQTQPNLSQATGKVDDLATGTEVSGSGKLGATAQNQTNLEPGNTYTSNKQQRGFKSNIAKDTDTPLSVYKSLTGKELTPELRKMFDDILGKEAEPTLQTGKGEGDWSRDVESKPKQDFAFSSHQRGSVRYDEKEILDNLKSNKRTEDINALGYMELQDLLGKVNKQMPKDLIGNHLFDKINAVLVNENGNAVIKLIDKKSGKINDEAFYKFKNLEDAAKTLYEVKENHRKLQLETLASLEEKGKETELTKYAHPEIAKKALEELGIKVPQSLVKAVEDLLGSPQKSNKPLESTPTETKGQETETTISETTEPTRSGESETATTVLEESNAGIAHRFNNPRREKIGLGEYEPTKESFEQWDREADAAIEKGYSVEGEIANLSANFTFVSTISPCCPVSSFTRALATPPTMPSFPSLGSP